MILFYTIKLKNKKKLKIKNINIIVDSKFEKNCIFILTYKMKKWFPDDTQSLAMKL
jgi:hypothetical protein